MLRSVDYSLGRAPAPQNPDSIRLLLPIILPSCLTLQYSVIVLFHNHLVREITTIVWVSQLNARVSLLGRDGIGTRTVAPVWRIGWLAAIQAPQIADVFSQAISHARLTQNQGSDQL